MRVGYLCMPSAFSAAPLAALLEAGENVRFVMRPLGRESRRLSRLDPESAHESWLRTRNRMSDADPFSVAERYGVPRYVVGDASSFLVEDLIRRERIDLFVIAFFNQLLRPNILRLLPLGAVNAHPSLLPRYRGPAPLFWTFRDGRAETGVTVHQLAAGEDDGPIILQSPHPLPTGMTGEALIHELSALAAHGFLATLRALRRGRLVTTPQDPRCVVRAPRPSLDDLRLNPQLSVARIYGFVRGVGRWNPIYVGEDDHRIRVVDADGVRPGARLPSSWVLSGNRLQFQCADGVVDLNVPDGAAS